MNEVYSNTALNRASNNILLTRIQNSIKKYDSETVAGMKGMKGPHPSQG